MIKIRHMRKEDYRNSIALWKSLPGLGLSGADEEMQIHRFLELNPSTCFVALEDDKLIGTVLGGSDGRRGYIYHLAIAPQHQRRRIGKNLVNCCLDAFRQSGLQKCHIFVVSDNLDGMKFWEHLNWVRRDDIVVMSKDL